MTLRRELGLMLALLLVAAASGCASMTSKPRPTAAGVPPAGSAPAPSTHGAAPTPAQTAPAAASIDTTTPSPAAERVLSSIPEPLTPAQQALNVSLAPPDTARRAVAPAAAYDSLQAAPVPAATQPLGTETSTVTMADSGSAAPGMATPSATAGGAAAGTSTASAAAPASAAAGATGAAAATAAAPSSTSTANGPCWRLQVGAPLESEKDKADSRREAAQSLLMVPFTIVPEKGYLKVRTSDCMDRDAADALKKRAVDSGFGDAFLIDTNAAPAAPKSTATKHKQVPASKHKK
jgi:hypothetical protein